MTRIPLQTKYAPKTMSELVFSSSEAALFLPLIAQSIHPCNHLMLYGSSGNGKTSASNIIAKEITQGSMLLLTEDLDTFLKHDDIRIYLSNITTLNFGVQGARCVIVFNELDKHKGSLYKLWDIMDKCEDLLMVIFTTNNATDFEAPVLSRCDKYEFTQVTPTQFANRAVDILKAEGISLSRNDLIYYLTQYTGVKADVRDYMRVLDKILTMAQMNLLPTVTKQVIKTAKPKLIVQK